MFKRNIIAASALLAMAAAGHAADAITFDTNGTAGGGLTNVGTFDWAPGNALALNGNPTGGLVVGSPVTVLYQANLSTINDATANSNILFGNGGGGDFFTAVATFNEVVTAIDAVTGKVTFGLAAGTNTFQIFHATASGNNLTGYGFNTGTQILSGTITSLVSGNFSLTADAPVLLDQFGGDDLAGQLTRTGSGATDINIQALIGDVDTNYFTDLFSGSLLALSFFNTSLVDPFKQVQPSNCFLDSNATAGCDGTAPNLGTVNGGLNTTGPNRNFQFQADANESFTRVPEPASLALVGLGLLAMGWSAKRKSKQA